MLGFETTSNVKHGEVTEETVVRYVNRAEVRLAKTCNGSMFLGLYISLFGMNF